MTLRSIPSEIGHLSDVDTTTTAPSGGDALVWDGANWAPGEGSGGTAATMPAGVLVETSGSQLAAAPDSVYVNNYCAAYDADTDRTYLAFLGEGRDCYATYFAHATGTLAAPVFVGTNPLSDPADNHGGPTLAIDQDGHVHIVWGGHGRATVALAANHQHSRSDNPHDISAWTTQDIGEGTYPHLHVASNGDLLIFDRADDNHGSTFPAHEFVGVRRSTDGGLTWDSPGSAVIDTTGSPEAFSDAYLFASSMRDDGTIDLFWTVARGAAHDGTRSNVYHAIFDPATNTLSSADGTALGATVDWTDHTACLAATATNVQAIRAVVFDGDRIHAAYTTGTIVSGEEANMEIHVTTWGGTAWSSVDTGARAEWFYQELMLGRHGDKVIGVFGTRTTADRHDLTIWVSPDGATWHDSGVRIAGSTGEGFSAIGPVNGGPWFALAQEMADDWARTNATTDDLLPIHVIGQPTFDTTTTVTSGGTVDAATIRDAGRWEVVVTGSPAVAVTTADGSDWLYTWVSD